MDPVIEGPVLFLGDKDTGTRRMAMEVLVQRTGEDGLALLLSKYWNKPGSHLLHFLLKHLNRLKIDDAVRLSLEFLKEPAGRDEKDRILARCAEYIGRTGTYIDGQAFLKKHSIDVQQ